MIEPREGRYRVRALYRDGQEREEGATNEMGEALGLILRALHAGAIYASQVDTRPDEPKPVSEVERAALADILPQPVRTMG